MSENQTQTRQPTTVLGNLYVCLTPNERRNFWLLMALVLFMAAFQTAGVIAVMLFGNAFTVFTMYWLYRYVDLRGASLRHRLFRQYLYQPYSYFLAKNTSELSRNILSEARSFRCYTEAGVANQMLRERIRTNAGTCGGRPPLRHGREVVLFQH